MKEKAEEPKWYVVKTNSRAEKKVHERDILHHLLKTFAKYRQSQGNHRWTLPLSVLVLNNFGVLLSGVLSYEPHKQVLFSLRISP